MNSYKEAVVEALRVLGTGTVAEIAAGAGCSKPTVRKHLLALENERRLCRGTETYRGKRKWWVWVYALKHEGAR